MGDEEGDRLRVVSNEDSEVGTGYDTVVVPDDAEQDPRGEEQDEGDD
jgi:hypothetical protein